MSTTSFDASRELARLLEEGAITMKALEVMTGIDHVRPRKLLVVAPAAVGMDSSPAVLTGHEAARLSALVAQLTEASGIGDDDRLRATLESLTGALHLTPGNIARLTGLSTDVVQTVLAGDRPLPGDEKYAVAIRCSYLVNAANLARPR